MHQYKSFAKKLDNNCAEQDMLKNAGFEYRNCIIGLKIIEKAEEIDSKFINADKHEEIIKHYFKGLNNDNKKLIESIIRDYNPELVNSLDKYFSGSFKKNNALYALFNYPNNTADNNFLTYNLISSTIDEIIDYAVECKRVVFGLLREENLYRKKELSDMFMQELIDESKKAGLEIGYPELEFLDKSSSVKEKNNILSTSYVFYYRAGSEKMLFGCLSSSIAQACVLDNNKVLFMTLEEFLKKIKNFRIL